MDRTGHAVPVAGRPLGVRFKGRLVYLWFGEDEEERDCFAARKGCVLTFASEQDACQWATAVGSISIDGEDVDVVDFGPVEAWLSRRQLRLDPSTALELWNLAGDIAYSTGRPWLDRGRLSDACYDKLFVANVPWMAHLETYQPRWTPRQLKQLRLVLSQAIHLLSEALPLTASRLRP